jgi:hypothetical protein
VSDVAGCLQKALSGFAPDAGVAMLGARGQRVSLGETFGQAWERMDAAERRTMLLDSGITVALAAGVGQQLYTHVNAKKPPAGSGGILCHASELM